MIYPWELLWRDWSYHQIRCLACGARQSEKNCQKGEKLHYQLTYALDNPYENYQYVRAN